MKFPFKKVLVTGGAGFIGSHLIEALVAEGCQVTVLDNLSSGHISNLDSVIDYISFCRGDIRDLPTIEEAARDCEAIFHLAAMVSVPQTVERPLESAAINDLGTLQIFEAARNNNVGCAVYISSSAIYGDEPQSPKHEGMNPKPLSPYAVHKLSGEYYARLYHELYKIKTTSLRLFNVFGPRQDPSSPYSGVISIFMSKAIAKSPPTIYGDGNQSRDFVYVKDVVKACLLAAKAENTAGIAVNVGTGSSLEINRLWEMICQITGVKIKPQYMSPRPGDILESVADLQRAKSLLGFEPEYSFEKGLAHTFEWYKRNR
ncbi:MAG: SDR family oxidoreductase [Deltaproteobacteria bacterium]|nr:MAG: SDR family oxidoreductase [Deltaproteobacteria bacterium]